MQIFRQSRPATLADVSWLRSAMCAEVENLRLKPEIVDDLALVVSEIGANLVNHASRQPSFIEVELTLERARLSLTISDDGAPFADFRERCASLTEADLFDESGRGLYLVSKALDKVTYAPGAPNRFVGSRNLVASQPSILIIEDTPALLELFTEILSDAYSITGCGSIREARVALGSGKFDAVLADFHLGDERSSILFDEEATRGAALPPVVFISSDKAHDVHDSCLRQGAEFFISKPVQAGDLKKTLALALTRAGMREARLNRTFADHVGALLDNRLPDKIGPYRASCLGASATAGGGDIVLQFESGGRNRLVIADVMGHGVSARAWAISLATSIRTLQRFKPDHTAPEFLNDLARLTWDEPALQGAMATVLVADLDEHGVEIASAGHPAPFLAAGEVEHMSIGGPLLGVAEPATYESRRIPLSSGDRLILFTDGVDHLELAGDALPGWIGRTLSTHSASSLADLEKALRRAAGPALGPRPCDDWTLVVVERS